MVCEFHIGGVVYNSCDKLEQAKYPHLLNLTIEAKRAAGHNDPQYRCAQCVFDGINETAAALDPLQIIYDTAKEYNLDPQQIIDLDKIHSVRFKRAHIKQ